MSYLKELNHQGLANIIICPYCGSESFTAKMESSLQCNDCKFWFLLTRVNINFGMKANRTVYASTEAMRSNDDWDWQLRLKDDSISSWDTWSEKCEEVRIDTRSCETIKLLMNNKLEAYKVTLALTSNFKK